MPTTFPTGSPGEIFERGMHESDIYVIESGPKETRGVGQNVPITFVETDAREPYDRTEVERHLGYSAAYDPQRPRLLSYAELADRALSYQVAVEAERQRATDEFDVIVG